MAATLEKHKADIERLLLKSQSMLADIQLRVAAETRDLNEVEQKAEKVVKGKFESEYQKWYTEAHAVIRQIIPDRLSEFEVLYKGDGKRREISVHNYSVQDWLNGVRSPLNLYEEKVFNDLAIASMKLHTQHNILDAATRRFESTLFDIKQLAQADLFDTELDAARELLKHGFLRGAGAVSGVVLEKHLAQVAENHKVSIRKQHPTIGDLNNALKEAGVLDVPAWRSMQRLGDLRNLCDHNKQRDPTKDEVGELIDGVQRVIKTLF